MKYIAIILVSLFLTSNASADVKVLFKHSETSTTFPYAMRTLCIDGYKWVHTAKVLKSEREKVIDSYPRYTNIHESETGNAVSVSVSISLSTTMTQFYEEKDGKSLPAKC